MNAGQEANVRADIARGESPAYPEDAAALLAEFDYIRLLLKDAIEERGHTALMAEVERLRAENEDLTKQAIAATAELAMHNLSFKIPDCAATYQPSQPQHLSNIVNSIQEGDWAMNRPWEPYVGPKGGKGIKFTDNGQIVYGVVCPEQVNGTDMEEQAAPPECAWQE